MVVGGWGWAWFSIERMSDVLRIIRCCSCLFSLSDPPFTTACFLLLHLALVLALALALALEGD